MRRLLDESLKKDEEVVKHDGFALKFAHHSLKKDRTIVWEAISQNGNALRFADAIFQNDREIVLRSVRIAGGALQHASDLLKVDHLVVFEAVKQSGHAIQFAHSSFRKDRELALKCCKIGDNSFAYVDGSFKKEREFVLESVKSFGTALLHVHEPFKKDKEIVFEAIKQSPSAFFSADDSFRKKDREFILKVAKCDEGAIYWTDYSIQSETLFAFIYSFSLKADQKEWIKGLNSTLYENIERAKAESIQTCLSRDVIGMYSNKFSEEAYLFCCLALPDTYPKPVGNIFNFNQSYSSQFVEKLIIVQILKSISSLDSTCSASVSKTIDYYLFLFKLDRFLDESNVKSTNYSKLGSVVMEISSKFETSYYSKTDIGIALLFFKDWISRFKHFDDHL